MELYFDRERKRELLATPFVRSWIGDAHEGDLESSDFNVRKNAWAYWALSSLVGVTGYRDYTALALPGKFYDPKGTGELRAQPHLEIPASKLAKEDREFPARLALAGNVLQFPWWLYSEVVATKRVLFGGTKGPIEPLLEILVPRGDDLRKGLTMYRDAVRSQWATIGELLVATADEGLVADACNDFNVNEVNTYLPGAKEMNIEIKFEEKLREKNGIWAPRRVGVWQIQGVSGGDPFSTGVLTPRLTANSTLNDPLFAPEKESLGALLVRSLVLQRIATNNLDIQPQVLNFHIGVAAPAVISKPKRTGTGKPYLRSIVSHAGEKTPEASEQSAVAFVGEYPNQIDAWKMLTQWAGTNHTLTVSRETFFTAHQRAQLSVRRAETPDRDDINLILPLAWNNRGQVVRILFARGRNDSSI